MDFSQALEYLKKGHKVARTGWNGKGMWLKFVNPEGRFYSEGHATMHVKYPLLPFIGMKTADDKFVPWLASQTDILAEDWVVL